MANYVSDEEVLEQAGFQDKERGEVLTGVVDGVNKIFYTSHTPIADRTYDGAVDPTDVVVYVNGAPVVVDTVVAADGQLTLHTAPALSAVVTGDYDWSPIYPIVVAAYHAQAHDQIQSTLAVVYALPLQSPSGPFVPPMVQLLEKRFTAGLLLDKEYSVGGDETKDNRGTNWIKEAKALLKSILDRKVQLMDASGTILTQRSAGIVAAYPDSSAADNGEADDGVDIRIKMKQRF